MQLSHTKGQCSPQRRANSPSWQRPRVNMYLICNIGLLGGKITYCKSACMVVWQPTQEKDSERKNLSDPTISHQHNHTRNYRQKIFYPSPRCKALAMLFPQTIAPLCYAPDIRVYSDSCHYILGIDKVRFL